MMKKYLFTLLIVLSCYYINAQCSPIYSIGCSNGKFIDSVYVGGFLSTIDNISGCTGSVPNFVTTYFDTVCLISAHPISMHISDTSLKVNAYIDYNHNGLFGDLGELVFQSVGGNANPTGTFTVPTTAMFGVTKMRIIATDTLITNPCGSFSEGETEEYFVNIIQAGPGGASCGCVNSSNISIQACDSVLSPSANQVWTVSGNYTDTLMNSTNCDSIIFAIVVIDTLTDSIYAQSDTLWAQQSNAQYQWYNCTSLSVITGQNSQWFKPTTSGSYACILTKGNCIDTSNCILFAPNSVEQHNLLEFLVYPNPANDHIVISTSKKQQCTIKLCDPLGNALFRKELFIDDRYVLDVSSYPLGPYIIKIDGKNYQFRKKIIKTQ